MKESPVQVDGSLCWSMGREGAQLVRAQPSPGSVYSTNSHRGGRRLGPKARNASYAAHVAVHRLALTKHTEAGTHTGGRLAAKGKWPREVSPAGFCTPRLGAMEVQMAVWPQGDNLPKVSLVHSKLASNTWPKIDRVIKTIAGRLPAKLVRLGPPPAPRSVHCCTLADSLGEARGSPRHPFFRVVGNGNPISVLPQNMPHELDVGSRRSYRFFVLNSLIDGTRGTLSGVAATQRRSR
jgi:hypothetical protein